jgi:hypothetical protein
MALWSRTRAEATSGQAAGEKPRLSHIGPRATDLEDHAVEREENEPEGRSMDSEEFRSKTRAGTYNRPSLGEEPRPMLLMVQGTRMSQSRHADEREEDEPEGRSMDSEEFTEEFRSRTRAGTYSRPSLGEEPRPMLLTVQGTRMSQSRHADEREEDEPEGRSEYSDEYILRSFGAHRGPKLDLSEERCDRYGDWLAIKNAATDWLKDHPTFSGTRLCEAIEEPMGILATNYRTQETEAKPGGIESEDWIKPCEEDLEIEELEKLKSKMKTMSRAGAMWLKGALGQRLRDAMPDD